MDDSRARKNESAILSALAERGQRHVADELGMSESAISRMKEGQIAQIAKLLSACHLKAVPINVRCFDPSYIEALHTIAATHLRTTPEKAPLLWED